MGWERGAERHRESFPAQYTAIHRVSPTGETRAETAAETAKAKKASKERMVKSDLTGRVPEKRGMNQSMRIIHGFRRFFASAHRLCPLVRKVCATPQLDRQRTGGTIRRRPQTK